MLRLVESKRMLHQHILPSPPVFLDSNMQIHLSGPVQGGMGLLGPRAESFNHIRAQEKLHRMTHYQKKRYFQDWHETVQTRYHCEVAASGKK